MHKINADLIHSDITYGIRGAIFDVFNELGFGHKENLYQKALAQEFNARRIPYEQEADLKVAYKGTDIGTYRPDFVIDGKVILEIKALEIMPKRFESQLIHYLKTTGFNLGLLVNFGSPNLYIKRLVWTGNPRKIIRENHVLNQRGS